VSFSFLLLDGAAYEVVMERTGKLIEQGVAVTVMPNLIGFDRVGGVLCV
jgi:hypothetical protein